MSRQAEAQQIEQLIQQAEDTARLRDAAPDLLRELERLVDICDRLATLDDGSNPCTLGAYAAIAKAKGNT